MKLKKNLYNHLKIEKKWQKFWEKNKTFHVKDTINTKVSKGKKKKFYGLIEFPYPSGDGIHMGHIRTNTAMDIICRKRRMEGYNVLYPIGWDAFGLPTENYAIKTGIHPTIVTKNNINSIRKQLKSIGFSFDWSREINTSDPNYYKWTQWIFLKLFEKGLAYKKKMFINWCPKCKIGLANEEVINNSCERCETIIEKKEKEQWMLAITKYADRLEKDLDSVNYLEKIKIQQRNWIGKSEGAELEFKIKNVHKKIKVFTTRPDTLFGVTYLVLAPENELVQQLKSQIKNWEEVEKYIKEIKNKTEIERTNEEKNKTGIELKEIKAINPANNEEISVWIADYVLGHYGTGAIMAVPAHDERDYAFAKKYNLPIKNIIVPRNVSVDNFAPRNDVETLFRKTVDAIIENDKGEILLISENKENVHFVGGGQEVGETILDAIKKEITEESGYVDIEINESPVYLKSNFSYRHIKNKNQDCTGAFYHVKLKSNKKIFSEVDECKHTMEWVKKDEVANKITWTEHRDAWLVFLNNKSQLFTGDGIMINSGKFNGKKNTEIMKEITEFVGGKMTIIYKLRDWIFSRQHYWGEPIPIIHCKKCGIVALVEKDLPLKLPFVKNYQPTDNGESPLALISKWVNTKCPKCGGKAKRETDTMPNWAGSSWYFLRYTDPKNKKEFAKLKKLKYWTPVDWYNGGMEHVTLHLLYSRFWHKFLYDLKLTPTKEPYLKRTSQGFVLGEDGEKMSKSRGNVINPNEIIKNLGADSLRIYEMFMGPFDQAIIWSSDNIIGSRRFLEKVWKLQNKVVNNFSDNDEIILLLNQTIKKVDEDIESMNFNTAISCLMIFSNFLEKQEKISKKNYLNFIKILSPFAPHICEEIWQIFGGKKSIILEKWPKYDKMKLISSKVKIAVQINGKVRAIIEALIDSQQNIVEKEALKNKVIIKWITQKKIIKIIFIKNKIINFVVSN